MRSGEGIPFVWISIDTTPATTREVLEYRIWNNSLDFECRVADIGSVAGNKKITLTRGVYVGGTLYSVASPTWFVSSYETCQGITTLRGFAFKRASQVLAADVAVSTLLTNILSPDGITASFANEYPKTINFAATGALIYLSTKGDILNHLHRKYFMSAFARENATIYFRSMGYGATNSNGAAYTIPSDAILTTKKSIRVNIVCTWTDESGVRHYNYTPPTTKPVQDCGYIESTISSQYVTDSSEDKAPEFEFRCRPDFTLEDGDLLALTGYVDVFIGVEEIFKRRPHPLWQQIVRDLPYRPATAAAGSQIVNLSDEAIRLRVDASRFTILLGEVNQSIQSALEQLDKHTH